MSKPDKLKRLNELLGEHVDLRDKLEIYVDVKTEYDLTNSRQYEWFCETEKRRIEIAKDLLINSEAICIIYEDLEQQNFEFENKENLERVVNGVRGVLEGLEKQDLFKE
jgi:hypothetical protein